MTPQELLQLQQNLFTRLEPAVRGLAYELVAVELTTVNGRRTLRVSVDRPGGVAFADLSRLSHALSALMDVEDPFRGAYDLEVSSPGIERPLQRLGDFARFAGYRAKVQLMPDHPRRRFTGVLRGLDGEDVLLDMDGATHRLAYATIQRAQLVLDLAEYEALGRAPAPEPAASEPAASEPAASASPDSASSEPAPSSSPDSGGSP